MKGYIRRRSKGSWEICQLVRKRGGPPKGKGIAAFWESVRNEWNDLHPEHKYQNSKGVKVIYQRVIWNLKGRLIADM